jgi:hypothetical protein
MLGKVCVKVKKETEADAEEQGKQALHAIPEMHYSKSRKRPRQTQRRLF